MFDKGGKNKGNKIKGLSQDSNPQLWSVECTHKPLIQQSVTSWSILKCLYPVKFNTRWTELGKSVHLQSFMCKRESCKRRCNILPVIKRSHDASVECLLPARDCPNIFTNTSNIVGRRLGGHISQANHTPIKVPMGEMVSEAVIWIVCFRVLIEKCLHTQTTFSLVSRKW